MKTLLVIIVVLGGLILSPLAFATGPNGPPWQVCHVAANPNGPHPLETLTFDTERQQLEWLQEHEADTRGACSVVVPTVLVAPKPKPAEERRELCSPVPMLRADGTVGIYQDWTLADYQDVNSKAHNWPLAVYVVGKGLTCDPYAVIVPGLFEGIYQTAAPYGML